jgi:hypothetical protein
LNDPQSTAILLQRAFGNRLAADPLEPTTHYAMGVLEVYLHGPANAAGPLRRALDLHPMYPRAATKLTLCEYGTGDNHQALEQLTRRSAPPEKGLLDLHYKTSLLYCSRPRFAASMINLTRNLNQDMARIDPAPHLRIVLENLGILDRGEAMLDWLRATVEPCLAEQGQS